ncbi:MAG: hypothetical protein AB2693_01070, partial [Candidatus Thiodiazotropha sp.]
MPKSQADKHSRFEYCDAHPKLLKDQFCCEHKLLLCFLCFSSDHKGCPIKTVQDACKTVDHSETNALYRNIKCLQDNLKSELPSVDKKIKSMKDQEKLMLSDTQKIYDQMIAKVKNMLDSINNEIQTSCQFQISNLSRHKKKVKDTITKLDSPLSELRELRNKSVDTKLFLRLQDIVSYMRKFTSELQESCKSHNFKSLSFVPTQNLQEVLSTPFTFGAIHSSEPNVDSDVVFPEIFFPVYSPKQKLSRPKTRQASGNQNLARAPPKPVLTTDTQYVKESAPKPLVSKPIKRLPKIKASKKETYRIKQREDSGTCCISGIAICKDRILMTDKRNNKVKMFSHEMIFLCSAKVYGTPRDIAVISEKEAVASTYSNSLVILDISGSQFSIKKTTNLKYDVLGISRYNEKLVVINPYSKPPFVKLIDKTGRTYWSLTSDKQGQPLFNKPWYISSPGDGRSSTVIVTDEGSHTLTLLNGDTGEVITRRQLKGKKYPNGVTTDSDGNIYVCYRETSEVAVLS